jgi:hypothetical protein
VPDETKPATDSATLGCAVRSKLRIVAHFVASWKSCGGVARRRDSVAVVAGIGGAPSFGPGRKNGKAGPATGSGSHIDAVSQNSDRLAHDEEADAQTVASRRIETGEGIEH